MGDRGVEGDFERARVSIQFGQDQTSLQARDRADGETLRVGVSPQRSGRDHVGEAVREELLPVREGVGDPDSGRVVEFGERVCE